MPEIDLDLELAVNVQYVRDAKGNISIVAVLYETNGGKWNILRELPTKQLDYLNAKIQDFGDAA